MSLHPATAVLTPAPIETLMAALHRANPDGSTTLSTYARCLASLLTAIGWRGDGRTLVEALPHYVSDLNLADFRDVMSRLSYKTVPVRTRLRSMDPRLLPVLFVPDRGEPIVVRGPVPDLAVHDPEEDTWTALQHDPGRGTAFVVKPIASAQGRPKPPTGTWFRNTMLRFKPHVAQAIGLTFFINILSLLTPLAIMLIYDKGIGSASSDLVVNVAIGFVIAAGLEVTLRGLRARVQAHVAARISYLIGSATFEKVLMLPVIMTQQAPVGSQLSRLKEFQSLREFFTSNIVALFLDLPFSLLFVATIAVIAGPLALIPVVLLLALALAGALMFPMVRRRGADCEAARSERTIFVAETMRGMRAIKELGAERLWMERFREIDAEAALTNQRATQVSTALQIVSQTAMLASGVAALGFGVVAVMAGDMTMGALIATMTLIWRILSPVQVGFVMLNRLQQFRTAVEKLNQFMQFRSERRADAAPSDPLAIDGRVVCYRVVHRYRADQEPALNGVSFKVDPGQLVALAGSVGSGKSTLLKLILGLYAPTAGAIEIDGVDSRQLDPLRLRQAIGYVPQRPSVFYGTIAQNLRLLRPTATDAELEEACATAAVLDDIRSLPDGFDTRVDEDAGERLSAGFLQRLGLARAYLRKPSIILMDEPASALDEAGDAALMQAFERIRGSCTVIYVTHRPSHMKMADRLVILDRGSLLLEGPPNLVMPKVSGKAAA